MYVTYEQLQIAMLKTNEKTLCTLPVQLLAENNEVGHNQLSSEKWHQHFTPIPLTDHKFLRCQQYKPLERIKISSSIPELGLCKKMQPTIVC